MDRVQPGDVLVTDMTDPNWEPVMKRASAIVTNRGGRTCHAAIIARELGIPAVVGCGDATERLQDGALVTVACSEGDTGYIYDGLLETEVTEVQRGEMPYCPIKIMMNVGNPQLAFDFARCPTPASAWRGSSSSSTTTSGCTPRPSSTTRTSTPT
jgi:pyruvate,water dikinase